MYTVIDTYIYIQSYALRNYNLSSLSGISVKKTLIKPQGNESLTNAMRRANKSSLPSESSFSLISKINWLAYEFWLERNRA